ncbi:MULTISPECIES: bifunctional adenosylcobinamide kinase/adenosylcobinamide-phosphate guanylyltransferase [unclassified Lysinibacillus]|uniref:bifunctional adenosylcobinamide kinase/adenosylcobinamide-phosphate guanylyltransferase n=1 Tax=unclassified Lysinibacillus TaxID=2636778 RepID=UPI0007389CEF|nr:bifunctional adenosylcobinamide kinase/adenosylcobinamide-phosphate guanylyltransferase [Lysinibacillus sp. F5]KUF29495.1 cobinamide kinase [Lysinibacillus sp. F5]
MPLIFITGGVRSGKSHFAEKAAMQQYQAQFNTAKRLIYLASGLAVDREMEKRIHRHQADRQAQPIQWLTVEAPYAIAEVFETLQDGDVVLWDCVTTWLTNAFYEGYDSGTPCVQRPGCLENKLQVVKQAIQSLLKKNMTFFVVSNELFDEPPYNSDEVELYRRTLGQFHQWFVAMAQEAYEMNDGIVKRWK